MKTYRIATGTRRVSAYQYYSSISNTIRHTRYYTSKQNTTMPYYYATTRKRPSPTNRIDTGAGYRDTARMSENRLVS